MRLKTAFLKRTLFAGCILFVLFDTGCQKRDNYAYMAGECNAVINSIYADIAGIKWHYSSLDNFGSLSVKEAPAIRPGDCISRCEPWDLAKISYQGQVMRRNLASRDNIEGLWLSVIFSRRPYDTSVQYVPADVNIYIPKLRLYLQAIVKTNDRDLFDDIVKIIQKNAGLK